MPQIHAIYRYPVKGLSPERLARTALTRGETVPATGSMRSRTGRPASTPSSTPISPSSIS